MSKHTFKMRILSMMIGVILVGSIFLTKDKVYAANIDTVFPASYKELLNDIAKQHPSWSFVAVETGLDWNDVISSEASGNRSLTYKTYADILLSKETGHYKASGTSFSYVPIDGSNWVNVSKPGIAYYMDPRNFLTEQYIFQFEALGYSEKYHNIEGVEAILEGTDLEDTQISYTTTKGTVETLEIKYSEAILEAGKNNGVSPLFLASKIRQETGASLTNNSISGIFSYEGVSYKGYYNFYNIGANATATGSAVANGLSYAKKAGWDTPVKSIEGGASFLAKEYISRGQNTGYFQKFNVVSKPYYGHQYMQNITAAATEGNATYTAYDELGIIDKGHVFYIPVYKNMPTTTSKVSISKTVKTGTLTGATNMRKGPSTSYDKVTNIPKDAKVTLNGAVYMENTTSIINRLKYPYWYKVTYKASGNTYTGYAIANNITADEDMQVKAGKTKQLKVTKASSEKVYYETSNPTIATVDSNGVITGVKSGSCQIFAITSSGLTMDSIGITVYSDLLPPVLKSVSNVVGGVKITWSAVEDAEYYRVYRKEPGESWARITQTTSGSTVSFVDSTAKSNKTYLYTVRAGQGTTLSNFDTVGLKTTYLPSPKLDKVSANGTKISFVWNEVEDATGYYVYRKTPDKSWVRINEFKVSDLEKDKLDKGTGSIKKSETKVDDKTQVQYTYVDKDSEVEPGAEYLYTVRAYNSKATSWYDSKGLSITTLPKRSDITKVENVAGGVKLTWSKVEKLDSYAVYRKTPDKSYARIATITDADTVTYTDKTAKSGTTYVYTVRTIKGSSFADYNRTGNKIMYLARPDFAGLAVKSNAVRLTWSKVTGAKGYYLYRMNSSKKWVRIATIKSGSTVQYIDEGRAAGTKYTYTIKAYNGSYVSTFLTSGVTATTSKAYLTYKTTAKINYRSGAGTSYAVKGSLAKGQKVSVEKGYSKSANGYTWYRIKISGKEYYVASKYLIKA